MNVLLTILIGFADVRESKAPVPSEEITIEVSIMELNTVATDDGLWQKFEQWVFWGADNHVIDWRYTKNTDHFRKLDGHWYVTITEDDVTWVIKSKRFRLIVGPDTEVQDAGIVKRGNRKGIFRRPAFLGN